MKTYTNHRLLNQVLCLVVCVVSIALAAGSDRSEAQAAQPSR